jgi:hypothetical protein
MPSQFSTGRRGLRRDVLPPVRPLLRHLQASGVVRVPPVPSVRGRGGRGETGLGRSAVDMSAHVKESTEKSQQGEGVRLWTWRSCSSARRKTKGGNLPCADAFLGALWGSCVKGDGCNRAGGNLKKKKKKKKQSRRQATLRRA